MYMSCDDILLQGPRKIIMKQFHLRNLPRTQYSGKYQLC